MGMIGRSRGTSPQHAGCIGGVGHSRGCNSPLRGARDKGCGPDYRFLTGGVQDLILDRVFSSAFPRLFLPLPSLPAPQNGSTDDICALGEEDNVSIRVWWRVKRQTVDSQT